jgi:hypothetical protein
MDISLTYSTAGPSLLIRPAGEPEGTSGWLQSLCAQAL